MLQLYVAGNRFYKEVNERKKQNIYKKLMSVKRFRIDDKTARRSLRRTAVWFIMLFLDGAVREHAPGLGSTGFQRSFLWVQERADPWICPLDYASRCFDDCNT